MSNERNSAVQNIDSSNPSQLVIKATWQNGKPAADVVFTSFLLGAGLKEGTYTYGDQQVDDTTTEEGLAGLQSLGRIFTKDDINLLYYDYDKGDGNEKKDIEIRLQRRFVARLEADGMPCGYFQVAKTVSKERNGFEKVVKASRWEKTLELFKGYRIEGSKKIFGKWVNKKKGLSDAMVGYASNQVDDGTLFDPQENAEVDPWNDSSHAYTFNQLDQAFDLKYSGEVQVWDGNSGTEFITLDQSPTLELGSEGDDKKYPTFILDKDTDGEVTHCYGGYKYLPQDTIGYLRSTNPKKVTTTVDFYLLTDDEARGFVSQGNALSDNVEPVSFRNDGEMSIKKEQHRRTLVISYKSKTEKVICGQIAQGAQSFEIEVQLASGSTAGVTSTSCTVKTKDITYESILEANLTHDWPNK